MKQDETVSLEFLKHPVVWAMTIARLLIALYIFVHPLWGVITSMIADWVDSQILLHVVGITRPQYQLWDKNVDWFAYVVELSVAANYGLYLPFFLLLFWRFTGQFMFLKTHKRFLFVFFPNFFEVAFLWLVLFYPARPYVWLIAFLIAKQLHEIALHLLFTRNR